MEGGGGGVLNLCGMSRGGRGIFNSFWGVGMDPFRNDLLIN